MEVKERYKMIDDIDDLLNLALNKLGTKKYLEMLTDYDLLTRYNYISSSIDNGDAPFNNLDSITNEDLKKIKDYLEEKTSQV